MNSVLQNILNIIGIAAGVAKSIGNPDVTKGADLAGDLIAIFQAANQAHIDLTGQPIDPDKLKPFEPLA